MSKLAWRVYEEKLFVNNRKGIYVSDVAICLNVSAYRHKCQPAFEFYGPQVMQ